jgi:Tfp pilus assembly protein PilF
MTDRLDSWKEIAAHFGRRVRTVQRWEREEGMPVHRHAHRRRGTVFALRGELDAWWATRILPPDDGDGVAAAATAGTPTNPLGTVGPSGVEHGPATPQANGQGDSPNRRAPSSGRHVPTRRRSHTTRALQAAGILFAVISGGLWAGRLSTPAPPPQEDPSAVVQGRYLLHRGTREQAERAAALCATATTGPGRTAAQRRAQAAGYECLAFADYSLTRLGAVPLREGLARTIAAADKALALDPGRAEALALGAAARLAQDFDLAAAEVSLRRAITLDPEAALPHHRLANLFSLTGRHAEAIAELRAAQRAAPLSAAINDDGCWFFYRARRHAEAIVEAERALVLEPERPGALECVVAASAARGDHERTRAASVALLEALGDEAAGAVAAAPATEAARLVDERMLARLEAAARESPDVPASGLAYYHARLGHRDEAIAWLERAGDRREPGLFLVRVHPSFDSVRDDPRVERLLRSSGV